VLHKFKDVLLAAGSETLKVRLNRMDAIQRTIRMDQFIGGIPVLHGSVSVGIDDATGIVRGLSARFLPDRGLPRQPKISAAEAAKLAEENLVKIGIAKPGSVKTSTPTLAYTGTHPDSTRGHLVWAVPATYTPQAARAADGIFWFDAIDGTFVGQDAWSKEAAINVYTANNATVPKDNIPPLTLLFTHPGSSADGIANNAYQNLLGSRDADQVVGAWFHPSTIGLAVHAGTNWTNARHIRKDGTDYLLFGDGSAAEFKGPYGNSRDVVAHEYGHSIANLVFNPFGGDQSDAQSAAIDEAFGDVNAAAVDAFYRPGRQPADPATWTIGEVYTNSSTRGLRSMRDPKSMDFFSRDWFPAREGGPGDATRHNNATIMSHAFKLLATGGFHVRAGQPIIDGNVSGNIPSLFVPGLGPDKTWNIFFTTFNNDLIDDFVTFPEVRAVATSVANSLYGPVDADAVDRAFLAVGVGNNCSGPPQAPNVEAVHRCPRWLLRWPAVPGATTYYGEMNPVAWQWFNATTIVDGNATQCTRQVFTDYHAHVRACNGCGCSPWSNEVFMNYWPQCP
jgi:Zn-dependent metalloprotease